MNGTSHTRRNLRGERKEKPSSWYSGKSWSVGGTERGGSCYDRRKNSGRRGKIKGGRISRGELYLFGGKDKQVRIGTPELQGSRTKNKRARPPTCIIKKQIRSRRARQKNKATLLPTKRGGTKGGGKSKGKKA